MTLEKEFRIAKFNHKITIVMAKMIDYYETIMQGSLQIPSFMGGDTPEKLAERDVNNLIETDMAKFDRLYEKAYNELAVLGDF